MRRSSFMWSRSYQSAALRARASRSFSSAPVLAPVLAPAPVNNDCFRWGILHRVDALLKGRESSLAVLVLSSPKTPHLCRKLLTFVFTERDECDRGGRRSVGARILLDDAAERLRERRRACRRRASCARPSSSSRALRSFGTREHEVDRRRAEDAKRTGERERGGIPTQAARRPRTASLLPAELADERNELRGAAVLDLHAVPTRVTRASRCCRPGADRDAPCFPVRASCCTSGSGTSGAAAATMIRSNGAWSDQPYVPSNTFTVTLLIFSSRISSAARAPAR